MFFPDEDVNQNLRTIWQSVSSLDDGKAFTMDQLPDGKFRFLDAETLKVVRAMGYSEEFIEALNGLALNKDKQQQTVKRQKPSLMIVS